ncbi:tetratricopeptide repeat protein [Primorskyibacter sp. S87]|uniref:tetratricopeptide repeat protein n=1 Tax=Primorskyibacter sp. S87 TaxID=3415126 RepID=UPI003C79CBB9
MKPPGGALTAPFRQILVTIAACAAMVSCTQEQSLTEEALAEAESLAPGVDIRKEGADPEQVANRLMAAGEYELALDAYTRAALQKGMTPEILTGLGTANLGLGRLGQSEDMLRRAVEQSPEWPEAWNNLGVVLMERGKSQEAEHMFRRAYALDNGESDSIRNNLRLALANSENPANVGSEQQDYKLVRRGSTQFLIRKTP